MWLGLVSAANLGRFPVEVILNGLSGRELSELGVARAPRGVNSPLKKEGQRDLIRVIDNRQVLQESKAVIEVNFVEPGEDNSSP